MIAECTGRKAEWRQALPGCEIGTNARAVRFKNRRSGAFVWKPFDRNKIASWELISSELVDSSIELRSAQTILVRVSGKEYAVDVPNDLSQQMNFEPSLTG